MTHPTERLRHARQRGLEDYTDRDGRLHSYYVAPGLRALRGTRGPA